MVHPWAKYDKKSTQGFLRFRFNEILVWTDGRTTRKHNASGALRVGGIKTLPTYFIDKNKKIEEEQNIANEFNAYFISCSSVLGNQVNHNNVAQKKHTDYLKNPVSGTFSLKPVTESELLEICRSLKNTNSMTPRRLRRGVIAGM